MIFRVTFPPEAVQLRPSCAATALPAPHGTTSVAASWGRQRLKCSGDLRFDLGIV